MGAEIIKALITGGVSVIPIVIAIIIGYIFQKKLDTLFKLQVSSHESQLKREINQQQFLLEREKNQELTLLNFNSKVVSDLWIKRYESYSIFWKTSEILPQYPRQVNVTYGDLLKISKIMRDWYFEKGGLLLSEETKEAYFKLQEEIIKFSANDAEKKIYYNFQEGGDINDYEKIRLLFSAVRSAMTKDLSSRSVTII